VLNLFRLRQVGVLLLLSATAAFAEVAFAPAEWALQMRFPAEPKFDERRTPSPQGDEIAQRWIYEQGGDRLMIVRFVYPLVPGLDVRGTLYKQSVEAVMNSRSGVIRADERWDLGDYAGMRLLVEQPREKTHRELRFVLIGASLYFVSAEWGGGVKPTPVVERFLGSIAPQPAFLDGRAVEERERWREIVQGNFRLRYDASRWFRDPQPQEPGTVFLLRSDEMAEAEFTVSSERNPAATMEEAVISAARETSEWVKVTKRSKRLRGAATVEVLRYAARVDGVNYENHGYFYSGAEGTVQMRAWSEERSFKRVEGDIEELLDGLVVLKAK
jgi:hypothetical protein